MWENATEWTLQRWVEEARIAFMETGAFCDTDEEEFTEQWLALHAPHLFATV